jgi:hypothetical protein
MTMKLAIGILLIIHGLIVAGQSSGSFKPPTGGLANPAWVGWWPANLGQSWLLASLGLERMPFTTLILLLNLVGGIALVAAGLGVLGMFVPSSWWVPLAIAGATLSLSMLVIYLHPLYAIGIGANLAILIGLLWARWPVTDLVS